MKISLKELCIFAVSFLLTVVIIGLLFGGIISRIPTETLNNLPLELPNQALPVLLLLWAVVILPSLVAYWSAFKLYKRNINETEVAAVRKHRVIFTIIATPILVATAMFSIKVLAPPVFAPYTLHSVSESELRPPIPTPTPPAFETILRKADNADIEYKIISKDDALWLYKEEDKFWSQPLPLKKQFLRDFWYDSNSNQLFVVETVEGKDEERSQGEINEQISVYSPTENQLTTKTLLLHNPGIYSGSRILNFYPDLGKLLFNTRGGDGCGGWGKIWTLEEGIQKTIQEYATGCAEQKLPRYLGFNGKLLIFTTNKIVSPDDFFIQDPIILSIFTMDPLTLEKKIVVE